MQEIQLRYAIKFVADMDKAVRFYRDTLGLQLKFESPEWSEFVTGGTTLAMHPASDRNPAGKVELGFTVPDVEAFYRDMSGRGCYSVCPPRSKISVESLPSLWIQKAHLAVWEGRPSSTLWLGSMSDVAMFRRAIPRLGA
jgi:predicted enzyme related to lactoylglutathione lyase